MLTRVHGHFHLAQTLISGDDVYLTGFDGDPAVPPAERRALSHPLRDVAAQHLGRTRVAIASGVPLGACSPNQFL